MTFVFLQHPIALPLFLVSAGMILAVSFTRKYNFILVLILAIAGALSVSGLIFAAFYYAIPLEELLLLLMLLLLLYSIILQWKGGL